MNKEQVGYGIGKAIYNNGLFLWGGLTAASLYLPIDTLIKVSQTDTPNYAAVGVAVAAMSVPAIMGGLNTFCQYATEMGKKECIETIDADPGLYPMQNVDTFDITDKTGLDMLLDNTKKSPVREFATAFNAHADGDRAIIDHIEPLENSESYIQYRGKNPLYGRVDPNKVENNGFNGIMHYHPNKWPRWLGSTNYNISKNDRIKPPWVYKDNQRVPFDMIQLLAFNRTVADRFEPTVIGFNLKNTYIPSGDDPSKLLKASDADIKRYLAGGDGQ